MKFFTGLAFLVLSLNANAAFITFNQSNLSGHGAQATSGGFNVTNGGLNLEVFGNYWASLAPIDIHRFAAISAKVSTNEEIS